MKRWIKTWFGAASAVLATTHFSCATTLGTSLRDAAIDGAAGFVETATGDLLDRWFGSANED